MALLILLFAIPLAALLGWLIEGLIVREAREDWFIIKLLLLFTFFQIDEQEFRRRYNEHHDQM